MLLPARTPDSPPSTTDADTASAPKTVPAARTPRLSGHDLDPRLISVARPARAVTPGARIGFVAEVLRVSPYRVVPVVDAHPSSANDDDAPPRLLGLIREEDVLRALLAAPDGPERARLRESPAGPLVTPATVFVTPSTRTSEAAALLDTSGADALPVVDARGAYLGLVARSDLVQDLVRPFKPPLVGGMATPLGVYLTTGQASGGVGALALMLSGLVLFSLHVVAQSVAFAGESCLRAAALLGGPAFLSALLPGLHTFVGEVVPLLVQLALFLLLLRLSPVAGYHAAEHQVVHALERSEPLAVETVRAMPRVHPRCGTNLVAGGLLLTLGAAVFAPLLRRVVGESDSEMAGYVLAALPALVWWRSVGGWLQQHFTTRPATDAQIESGIRAARELLRAHDRAPFAPLRGRRVLWRFWRMGFLQIMTGFVAGLGLLKLLTLLVPALRPFVEQAALLGIV